MELKLASAGSNTGIKMTLNRTSMELKQKLKKMHIKHLLPLNRTSMELKLNKEFYTHASVFLLIEPVWN